MKNEMKNETTVIAPSDVSYRGLADGGAIVERKRERLFKDEVLASLRRRDRMGLVLTRV